MEIIKKVEFFGKDRISSYVELNRLINSFEDSNRFELELNKAREEHLKNLK